MVDFFLTPENLLTIFLTWRNRASLVVYTAGCVCFLEFLNLFS
jgi:hypothetical protein